ncbi:MAG: transglycosylase SLT domain-containing protein, partial [Granulosicoccaceae bacterium]
MTSLTRRAALRRLLLSLTALCLAVASVSLQAATRDTQRKDFKLALAAIEAGDMAGFYRAESKLRNYVLHDHLRFLLAQRAIKQGDLSTARRKAQRFESEFHGNFLAWRVMRTYRERLREEEQWQLLLESAAMPSAPAMTCETTRAKQQLGQLTSKDPDFQALWEKRVLSDDCAWVLEQRLAQGDVTSKYLWRRVYTLMARGRLKQVQVFKKHFNSRDQALIQAWVKGHDQPAEALADSRWHANNELNQRVFKHLISRLARRDAVQARLFWGQAYRAKRYDESTLNHAARTLGLRAASDYVPDALDWLRWLPSTSQDKRTREERARLAVRLGQWQQVLEAVEAMPSAQRQIADWAYWKAVAQLELGQTSNANNAFAALAKKRSYYGFLAADRIGKAYAFEHSPTPSRPALRAKLQAREDVQRMREYLFVGLRGEAQAQWKAVIKALDTEERAELSLLVLDWGWYDRAIVSNARTAYSDDLRVRFPFAYRDTLKDEAARNRLSWPWVYGVARRESLFQPEVRSGAGAVGLMQMMPATARDVAQRTKKKLYTGALENPEFSLALGTYYLRYLLDRFKDHQVMATAAYNAGLSRVPRWLDDKPMLADRWVESIPYRETRDYVKAVMAYATVYDWRSDGEVDVRL